MISNNLEELKKQHRQLLEAQAISGIGSFEWNVGDEEVEWSDEMYRIYGLLPQSERITIDRTNKFFHHDDSAEVNKLRETSINTAGKYESTHRILLANGTEKWVFHRFESISDETGKVVRVHGTLQDVTNRIKIEQELKETKRLLQKVSDASFSNTPLDGERMVHTWEDITQQKEVEQDLLRTKGELVQQAKRYLELFQSIDQGFCTITVKYNEDNRPVDYQFIEVSPSFEQQTGIKDAAGKWMRDIAADQDEFWFEIYGRVAKDRAPERFEHFSTPLNRWWGVYAFPIDEPELRRIGVLFNDITEQIKAKKRIEASEIQFRNVLLQSPNIFVILEGFPEMIISFANEPLFKSWGRTAEIIGKPLLEAMPELKEQSFPTLLQRVFETGETYHSSEEKAVLIKNGVPVDTYYMYVYQAIFDDQQKVSGVTIMATDITEQVTSRRKIEESEKRFSNLLMESPFAFAILKGKDMVVALANEAIKNVWGKGAEIEGQPLLSLMPEIEEQGFAALLDEVYITGKPFYGHEQLVKLHRNGLLEDVYFNFVYQPYKETDETISGVTIIANEVTTQAIANKKIAASERNVNRLFMQAPAVICVLRGPQHIIELANDHYNQLVGKRDMLGKTIREALPELAGQGFYELLDNVYVTGEPFIGNELPVQFDRGAGRREDAFVNFVYQASHNSDGKIDGVLVHAVDVTEQVLVRKKIEESEEKYHSLFNSIHDAFCIIEMIFDEKGKPVDWIYVETNPAFLQHATVEMKGKRISEIVPEMEVFWLEKYGGVAQTGQPVQLEHIVKGLGDQWFQTSAFRQGPEGSNKVAVLFRNITERKAAEEKLKESENRFRSMADASAVLIWTTDAKGLSSYYNKTFLDFLGVSKDEDISDWKKIVHPDDVQLTVETINTAIAERQAFSLELRLLRVDGHWRWVLAQGNPMIGANNEFLGFIGSSVDITDRKLAEEKIKKSEAQYKSLIGAAPIGIGLLMGRDLILESANQKYINLIGKGNDIEGKKFTAIMPELIGQPYLKILDDIFITGKSYQSFADPVSVIRNGILRHEFYDIDYAPLFDGEGKVYAVLNLATDVTIQTQLNIKLKESEKRFRNVLLDSPNLFVILEGFPEMIITFANEPVLKSWGRTAEIIGKPLLEALPEIKEQSFPKLLQRVFETGEMLHQREERAVLIKDGVPVDTYYEYVYQAIFDDNQKVTGITIMATDITAQVVSRKKFEESKEQQAYLLKLSDELRELTEPLEIQRTACTILGEQLNVTRVLYGEVINENQVVISNNYVNGVEPIVASLNAEHFGASTISAYKRNEKVIFSNILADSRFTDTERQNFASIDVVAKASIGLVKGGRWVAVFGVHYNAPREWTATEISLMEETAERTWAAVERSKTEDALRQSEEKYRTIFETIDEGFTIQELLIGEDGNVRDIIYREVNEAYAKHTGIRDALGKKASELFPNLEQHWLEQMTHVYKTGEPVRTEGYQSDINRWFTMQYSRLGGPGSRLISAVFNNITESKSREQHQTFLLKFSDTLRSEKNVDVIANRALQMLSDHLRLDRCYVGVYQLADDRGEFPYQVGNDRVPPLPDSVRLSDFPDALRVTYDRTLVIDDIAKAEGFTDADRKNLSTLGLCALVTATLRSGESSPLWSIVAVSASARHWMTSEIKLIEDVTERTWAAIERANAEETLRQSEEKYLNKLEGEVLQRTQALKESNISLQYANENLKQFASVASHDLQEPLRKLKLFASVLQKFKDELPDEGKLVLERLTLTSDRMSQLIREVLHYSKLAYGAREFVQTNLDSIFKLVLVDLELLIKDANAVIKYVEPLPTIEAIPLQMNQLLYNLMSNALKFRRDGIRPVVQLSFSSLKAGQVKKFEHLQQEKEYLEIVIADNGIGFDGQYAEQIFQIFERLHSAEEFEGTGVGLALCKKIIENHAGHIYAVSNEATGAVFHLFLPFKQ